MLEAGVLVSMEGRPLYWHLPAGRSAAYLPDSRDLWDVIWENRKSLQGFAHSHPGSGTPGPSFTDVTTFAAVEAGLGRRLDWWICSEDELILVGWRGPDRLSYRQDSLMEAPVWLPALRKLSYGAKTIEIEQGVENAG